MGRRSPWEAKVQKPTAVERVNPPPYFAGLLVRAIYLIPRQE